MFWTPKLCRICATLGTVTFPIFATTPSDVEMKFKKCFQINVSKDDFKPKEICSICLDRLNEYCMFLDLCTASNNKFESILYQTNRLEVQDNWQSDLFPSSGVIVKPDDIIPILEIQNDTFEQNQTVLRHSGDFYKPNVDINLDEIDFSLKKGEMETIFPAERFSCMECGKKFKRKLNLNAHMTSHTNIKPYSCDVCGKTFGYKSALNCHQKVHANVFQCEYCSKSFPFANKLERHVRTHTNDRPFKCEVEGCDKTFSDKCNLVGHQGTHLIARNFMCDVCKKSYKTKRQLKDHMKAHSDMRFTCEICDKNFKWRTNLLAHVRKHSEFKCRKCEVDLSNYGMFLMHKKDCVG